MIGAFSLVDGWMDIRLEMPPDDHNLIEIRFGRDPMPLRTTGRMLRRVRESFGPSPVPIFWRPISANH